MHPVKNGGIAALVGLAGQYMTIRAYEHCEESLPAPLSYTEIVTSTLVSWWFFREVPDAWTLVGVAAWSALPSRWPDADKWLVFGEWWKVGMGT